MPESDSEDDQEYIPPAEDPSSASSDEEDGPDAKRARVISPKPEEDEAAKKLAREDAWKSFQASMSTESSTPLKNEPKRMIKVEKKHLFAGQEVVEIVEVEEDSTDAKKWPRWIPPDDEEGQNQDRTENAPITQSEHAQPETPELSERSVIQSVTVSIQESTPASTSSSVGKPAPRRPGPRKSKTTLASQPSSSKPKKISMLEKSAMDWRSHIGSQTGAELKDELEQNRRGGGYLEKVEFLDRVQERKEDVLEKNKGTKRRRT
ncbi:hypothetical protein V5O48_003864 [Marasmius crinis-equi]|uniref:SWR1-complex protein 5 n=1 Tax=Marasmius crinis-equi TaxID=585013 RepID=A0ABR3FS06_9AGAR